jgi:uncharacterized membrane protein
MFIFLTVSTFNYTVSISGSSDNDDGPGDGEIAGVVIGCVVGVGLLFACIFWVVFFRKPSKGLADQPK